MKAERYKGDISEMKPVEGDENLWPVPPSSLTLKGDYVHIWQAALDQPPENMQQLTQVLSADEESRAGRFRFERDKNHFIAARGVLRAILGHYVSVDPDRLVFRYGSHGKPYLDPEIGMADIRFNLAHSHGLAVYGFTIGRDIGIDLEYMRSIPDIEDIASTFFSEHEKTVLDAFPEEQKPVAFYNCWTRKEAYIKATGMGLSCPLDQFDVSFAPGEQARLLNISGNIEEAKKWRLESFTPGPGYAAALAAAGHGWQPQFWRWQMDCGINNWKLVRPSSSDMEVDIADHI